MRGPILRIGSREPGYLQKWALLLGDSIGGKSIKVPYFMLCLLPSQAGSGELNQIIQTLHRMVLYQLQKAKIADLKLDERNCLVYALKGYRLRRLLQHI